MSAQAVAALNEAVAAAKEAAAAARRETAAVTRAMQAEADLQRRSLQLLTVQGRLSMRGAFDYIEEDLRFNDPKYLRLTRLELWRTAIDERPQLQQCLNKPAVFGDIQRTVSVSELASKVHGVCKTLSDHIHSNKSPSEYRQVASDKLEIVEGPLSKRQCRALECVCQAFGFPTDLKLITAMSPVIESD